MLPINITAIKYMVVAVVLATITATIYYNAYKHGRLEGQYTCIKETEELVQQIHDRINKVEKNLDEIADMATTQQEKLSKDIDEILKRIKAKPVVVIKNGKCIPSTNFLEGINEAIRRANQK